MATLAKYRARKPLSIARPEFNYGRNVDVNEGAYGVSIRLRETEASSVFTLTLTDDEVDRLIVMAKFGREKREDRNGPRN